MATTTLRDLRRSSTAHGSHYPSRPTRRFLPSNRHHQAFPPGGLSLSIDRIEAPSTQSATLPTTPPPSPTRITRQSTDHTSLSLHLRASPLRLPLLSAPAIALTPTLHLHGRATVQRHHSSSGLFIQDNSSAQLHCSRSAKPPMMFTVMLSFFSPRVRYHN